MQAVVGTQADRPFSVEKARILSRRARGELSDHELVAQLNELDDSQVQRPGWLLVVSGVLGAVLCVLLVPASSRRD